MVRVETVLAVVTAIPGALAASVEAFRLRVNARAQAHSDARVTERTSGRLRIAANDAYDPTRALRAIGSWADLDWDETVEELDRIRHESRPTPLLDLDR